MYIESIKFKREENSEWESGYYVGRFENCSESVILDKNYQPLGEKNNTIWHYHTNSDNRIKMDIPEREDFTE